MKTSPNYSALLYLALAEPIGLLCQTSGSGGEPEFERAVQRLYQARKQAGDPELSELQFRRAWPGADGDLVICSRRTDTGKRSLLEGEG